ncbi:hypothetical protein C2G38_645383 [Gigaspora rosea]|uniref:Poly [ADP-ribose] polymerase n=1 Tax=Gigaspora rosea TaxID=44941 RepID=A0A397U3S2_9GLOM|nr:hypothetical protein C2G38_645383 [Gigaspora rosea]
MTAGNEQRRFHGTSVSCRIGETGQLCSSNACAVCCIIKNGYKIFETTNFQRYGRGLYFSSISSKSDDYVKNNSGLNYRVMFLNRVIVGKAYKCTNDYTGLLHPPQGYDSVIGVPDSNGSLNYDEVVLYREDSCIPKYLIAYG